MTYPSASTNPWSPVRNQPSRNAAAVASGASRYPVATDGPRIASSPTAPGASVRPASSSTATSQPTARPTDPGLRTPGGRGLLAIWWAASVIP